MTVYEPDEEGWDAWKQRNPTKTPAFTVGAGRKYRKPSGRHPRKGFVHGAKPKRALSEREECDLLLAQIAAVEKQIAAMGG